LLLIQKLIFLLFSEKKVPLSFLLFEKKNGEMFFFISIGIFIGGNKWFGSTVLLVRE